MRKYNPINFTDALSILVEQEKADPGQSIGTLYKQAWAIDTSKRMERSEPKMVLANGSIEMKVIFNFYKHENGSRTANKGPCNCTFNHW